VAASWSRQVPAGLARLAAVFARMQQHNPFCCHILVKVVKYNYYKKNGENAAATPRAAIRIQEIPVGVIAC
jgi:hypothetical protein